MLGIAAGLLAGGISAGLFAVALVHAETLLIFLGYLAPFPLFVAGLGTGFIGGLAAAVTGIAGLYLTGSASFAFAYAVLNALPAGFLIALAMHHNSADQKTGWFPEGHLLTAITLYPCLFFLLSVAVTAGQDGGLLGLTSHMMAGISGQIKGKVDADTAIRLNTTVNYITKILPAFLGCAWIFVIMTGLAVAQKSLSQQNWNLRPDFDWRALQIPSWLIFAAAATGLMTLAPAPYDYIGTNLCIMLCVPFFFVGLAVTHSWAATTKVKTFALVLVYIILCLMPWTGLVVTALGAFDQWLNIRQRLTGQKQF